MKTSSGRVWPKSELKTLRDCYAGMHIIDLARKLRRTPTEVYNKAAALGIRKTKSHKAVQPVVQAICTGKDERGRFRKGYIPANKGKKGWRAGGRSKLTRFKAGQPSHNTLPIGSERVDPEGYRIRKIRATGYRPRDWAPVHRLLWIKHRGAIPAGHVVIFKNGNKEDIRLGNLKLLSKAENMRRNTIHRLPPELKKVIQLKAIIVRTITRREKREKQN